MLNSLVNIHISSKEDEQRKLDLEIKIDEIIDNGEFETFNDHLSCADQVTANNDKIALHTLLDMLLEMTKNIQ